MNTTNITFIPLDFPPLVANPGRQWTLQEVFDNALNGVRRQHYAPSNCKTGACAYRGNPGMACGIGWSIPDDIYSPTMDDPNQMVSIRPLMERLAVLRAVFPSDDRSMSFLTRVQDVHDMLPSLATAAENEVRFEVGMQKLAEEFHLNYASPTQP
jgi:hypothetical protein